MLYAKCSCGGKVVSAEPRNFEAGSFRVGHVLRHTAHRHPVLQAVHMAVKVGREVYKRAPGGGLKRCTVCKRTFR